MLEFHVIVRFNCNNNDDFLPEIIQVMKDTWKIKDMNEPVKVKHVVSL